MQLLFVVLIPFLAIVPVWLAARWGRKASAAVAISAPLAGLGLLGGSIPEVFAGETLIERWTWIERLGLDVAFRLDGLGMLFAILILGIGTLVVLYAYYYLSKDDPIGPFYAALMTFMGAMLGVVLSENLILLAVFWELTSISSFLLIGYWTHLAEARKGARLALGITGGGGLCLLGGVILLGHIAGSYDLTVVLASADVIQNHPLYPVTLVLILLGAFTKSAQFPFHFWLPNAMTAPTPVSAYLHSATMVKAGVFLLARLHPALSGTSWWFFIVSGTGIITMAFAAYVALFKHDLKGLLAYSTISHLGIITALFGFSTKLATVMGVFHIMNHAAFKASLFMSAGIVDHEAGTRDARVLSGLRHSMPITFVLALGGAAAMGGTPLFNGFLSKEMFFEEAFHLLEHPLMSGVGAPAWAVPVLVTLGGVFSVAYSIRFIVDVFFGPETDELPGHPHDPPFGMWIPVAVLVAICVVVGVVPSIVAGDFLRTSAAPVVGAALPEFHLAIWHGLTPALYMTMIAISMGILAYWRWRDIHKLNLALPAVTGRSIFEGFVERSVEVASGIHDAIDNGSLQRYLAFVVGFAVLAGFLAYYELGWQPGSRGQAAAPLMAVIPWGMMIIGSVMTVYFHRKRLAALVFVGIVGLITSLSFIYFSGPDLGLTQLSVEVVTILLMLLTLYVLPQWSPRESSVMRRTRDAIVAISAGVGVSVLAWDVMTRPQESISQFFLDKSLPEGGGTNVVNVILVDFRGFDTMGEISVLVIAAIGIIVMLRGKRPTSPPRLKPLTEERFPAMLTTVTRPLMALIMLMAVYIFFRGHNLPGGGFIAGLVGALALIIQYVASGIDWTNRRLSLDFQKMAAIGVIIAVGTGMAAWAFGEPFLTGGMLHLHIPVIGELHIGAALAFDTGVFLVVVGALLVIIRRLSFYQRADEVIEIKEDEG
ncbi:MAG: monovalent cation/H+ antiporter subunit A [Myxococcota bacterium]